MSLTLSSFLLSQSVVPLASQRLRSTLATEYYYYYFLVFARHQSSPSPTEQTEAAAHTAHLDEAVLCAVHTAAAESGGAHPTLSVRQLAVTLVANAPPLSSSTCRPHRRCPHPLGFTLFASILNLVNY